MCLSRAAVVGQRAKTRRLPGDVARSIAGDVAARGYGLNEVVALGGQSAEAVEAQDGVKISCDDAILQVDDGPRPALGDAPSFTAGGVAGDGDVVQVHGAAEGVDAAAVVRSRVSGDCAVGKRRRSRVIVDAATDGARVAADGAVGQCRRCRVEHSAARGGATTRRVVQQKDVDQGCRATAVVDAAAVLGRRVAVDSAVVERQWPGVVDAAAGD